MPKNFDQLPAAAALTGVETTPINQAGVTKFTTITAIKAFIASAFEAAGAVATGITAHLTSYVHGDIAHSNRAALDLVSGTNTGDQDISAWLTANKPGISSLESSGTVGAWTPSDVSGASPALTLAPVNCKYVKIGKLVQLMGQITFPTTADVAQAKIGGLPFDPICLHNGIAFNTTGSSLFGSCTVIPGPGLQFYNNFGAASARTNAALSGATVYVNISYITA